MTQLFVKEYKPVDTDLVDDLEHFASDHIHIHVFYKDHTGMKQELRGKVADVFTKDHQEFLKMEDGRELRLDQIFEVHADPSHFKKFPSRPTS